MKYYIPDLRLASQLGAQQNFEDKLGGLPWGLPTDQWPICRQCGEPMALLAQFGHDEERLDLGRPGRVAFVFQCNGLDAACKTWDSNGGANTAFVLEPEDMTDVLTQPTEKTLRHETEARVIRWIEEVDRLTLEQLELFTDERYLDLDDEILDSIPELTKLGSAPVWIQYPEVKDGFKVVAQLSSEYFFFIDVPEPDDVGCDVTKRVDGEFQTIACTSRAHSAPRYVTEWYEYRYGVKWGCGGANFGDAGIGYLLMEVDRTPSSIPMCKFLWQCS